MKLCFIGLRRGGGSTENRAVVKSTFVESKTRPSPKKFESKSSPNETVKTEKEKNYLLQNHILNY